MSLHFHHSVINGFIGRRNLIIAQTFGIGVIGIGLMGLVHSRYYRMINDRFHQSGLRTRLVICADDVESRAREAKERLDFEHWTADWKEVVTHPDVQIVNVASPNYLHVEMVRA